VSIIAIRFRMEGALCVLQVLEEKCSEYYAPNTQSTWRDADATDLLEVAKFTTGGDRDLGKTVDDLYRRLSRLEQQPMFQPKEQP